MPGYMNGIAQGQAQASDPNKDAPWKKATDFVSRSRFQMGAADESGMKDMGYGWDERGPQGQGYYKGPNQQEELLQQQQYYADQFNQNIPQMSNQLYNQAGGAISNNMDQGIKNVRQQNSSRGLLYGGVNAGQEGSVRAKGASDMASTKSNINQGLIETGQNMRSSAISSGVSYQQMQQALNNAVYQNAMSKLNQDNAMTSGIIGNAATIGAIAAFA